MRISNHGEIDSRIKQLVSKLEMLLGEELFVEGSLHHLITKGENRFRIIPKEEGGYKLVLLPKGLGRYSIWLDKITDEELEKVKAFLEQEGFVEAEKMKAEAEVETEEVETEEVEVIEEKPKRIKRKPERITESEIEEVKTALVLAIAHNGVKKDGNLYEVKGLISKILEILNIEDKNRLYWNRVRKILNKLENRGIVSISIKNPYSYLTIYDEKIREEIEREMGNKGQEFKDKKDKIGLLIEEILTLNLSDFISFVRQLPKEIKIILKALIG